MSQNSDEKINQIKNQIKNITDEDIAKRWLNHHCKMYERDKNPLDVWMAYGCCRRGNIDLPDWVKHYFDRIGEKFFRVTREGAKIPNNIESFVMDALEFKTHGRGTIFSKYNNSKDVLITSEIYFLIKYHGFKESIAQEEIAKKYNISKSKAHRCWKNNMDLF